MLPSRAIDNMRDKRPTSFEGEHEGFDLHAAFKEAAYFFHLLRRGGARVVGFPFWYPVLSGRIFHVVSLCARKEMVWVATRRVIAFVAYVMASRHFAKVRLIRILVWRAWFSVYMKVAMTAFAFCTKPNPTWTKFRFMLWDGSVLVDRSQETRFWRHTGALFSHS